MATPADGIWGHDANASSDSDDGVAFRTLELEDDEDGDEEYAPSEASDADADDDDDDDDDEVDDAMVDETLWADEADRANWEKEFERKNAKWKRQYGSRIDSEAQPLPSARLDAELRRNPWRRLGFFLGVLICAVQGCIIYQVHSEGATLTEAWTRLEDLGATVVLPSLYSALHDAIAVDEYGVDRAVPSDDSSNITTQDKADPDDASVTSDTDEPDASEVEPPTPVDTTTEEEPSTQVGESHDALDATTTAADTDDSVSQEAAEHKTTVIEDVVEVAITFDGDAALSAEDDDDNSSLPADANTLLDEAATLDTLASLDATQDEPALKSPHELEPATVQNALDEPESAEPEAAEPEAAAATTEPTTVADAEPTTEADASMYSVEAVDEMELMVVDPAPIERALTACTTSLQAMVRANYTEETQSAAIAACDAALVASSPSPPHHQEAWTRQGDRKNLVRDFAGAQHDYAHARSVFPSTTSLSLPLKLTSTRWLVLYLDRQVEELRDECEAYLSAPNSLPQLQHIARCWLQVLDADASEEDADDEAKNDLRTNALIETRKMILLR